jgi:hypothetical protein
MSIPLKAKKVLISTPEYWALPENKRPDTYEGILKHVHRKSGIWCIQQMNKFTGECEVLQVCDNAITTNGVHSMWLNTMNFSAGGVSVANIMAACQLLGSTTLGTTITSGGTVTSFVAGSLVGATIPSGSVLCIGAGGATKLFVTTTAAITGAGTISVTSTPGPGSSITAGAQIRYANQTELIAAGSTLTASSVLTTDVSSLGSPSAYTAALPTGQFTGSGRSMIVTNAGSYLFSTTANSNPSVATAASYNTFLMVNTSPVSSTTHTFIICASDAPVVVGASTTGQFTITETL